MVEYYFWYNYRHICKFERKKELIGYINNIKIKEKKIYIL
jgi:hypothetical protein